MKPDYSAFMRKLSSLLCGLRDYEIHISMHHVSINVLLSLFLSLMTENLVTKFVG
jgi:hypothetical protein